MGGAAFFLEVEDKLRAKNSLSLSVGLAYIKNKCNYDDDILALLL